MSHQLTIPLGKSHGSTGTVPLAVLSILIKKTAVNQPEPAGTKRRADDSDKQVESKRRADGRDESKRPRRVRSRPAGLGRGERTGRRERLLFTSHLCECLTAISRTWDGLRPSVLPGMADGAFRVVLRKRWSSVVCLVVAPGSDGR